MKYIRTKSRIYEVVEEYKTTYLVKAHKQAIGGTTIVYKASCINQANTIEELCDEFVLHYLECKDKCNIPWASYERRGLWEKEREHVIKEIISHPSYRQPVLKGAIWTNKGLIYVAKMNEKGELELL